jgi:hypothetical protein
MSGAAVSEVWQLDGGAFHALRDKSWGRDIRTRDTYRDFELRFEWKATPRANSGIKYRLFYLNYGAEGAGAAGFEYQIADNDGDPGARRFAVERAGGLYNQIAPASATPRALGEWNEGAIIVRGRHIEHWLNGQKSIELDCESSAPEGPIVFQHHGGGASLRNIRVKRL